MAWSGVTPYKIGVFAVFTHNKNQKFDIFPQKKLLTNELV